MLDSSMEIECTNINQLMAELFQLSNSFDIEKSADIVCKIAVMVGFDGCIIATSHCARRNFLWRVIAGAGALSATKSGAQSMPMALSKAFPDGDCVAIEERVAKGGRDEGFADSPLYAELAARGFRSVTPVYVTGLRKRSELGVLALSVEPPVAQRRIRGRLSVLRLALAAVAANCAEQTEMEPHRLSRSERMVLELLAAGLSPAEIAENRGTSIRTVRNQLESAKRRLEASTGVHAVALAIEMGAILYQDVQSKDHCT